MTKLRIVVDTNVLVSSIAFPKSVPSLVLRKVLSDNVLIFSQETVAEFQHVLFRPKFNKYIKLSLRQAFLVEVITSSLIVIPTPCETIYRDINDQIFLEVLQPGEVNLLITGDKDLLVLDKVGECKIITPVEFIQVY